MQYSAARFVSYPDALSATRAASCSRVHHGHANNDEDGAQYGQGMNGAGTSHVMVAGRVEPGYMRVQPSVFQARKQDLARADKLRSLSAPKNRRYALGRG